MTGVQLARLKYQNLEHQHLQHTKIHVYRISLLLWTSSVLNNLLLWLKKKEIQTTNQTDIFATGETNTQM